MWFSFFCAIWYNKRIMELEKPRTTEFPIASEPSFEKAIEQPMATPEIEVEAPQENSETRGTVPTPEIEEEAPIQNKVELAQADLSKTEPSSEALLEHNDLTTTGGAHSLMDEALNMQDALSNKDNVTELNKIL